jgi:GntR family transcriptional regulator/MocR family aminotransferase
MTRSRTSSATELFVPLDRDSGRSLHHQLEQQLREAVRYGRLGPEETLPSSRALASQLGVARGVVVEAYEQLAAEGYLVTRPGGTTRVATARARPPQPLVPPETLPFQADFRPGRPDLTEFPRAAWARSVRRVLNVAPAARLGYLDGHGMPELREALSAYLDRVRGTCTDPADIVICSGFAQGLQLLARALRRAGARRVGVEDPWHTVYRRSLEVLGLDVVPLAVDDEGMRVDLLEEVGVDTVVLTPAHQYPTGAVLSATRRAALIAWADRHDAILVEDDYDAEFRYDREPIGAMQGLCPDRVAYAGTVSKTLAPGLRLGWLAVPRHLSARVARTKVAADLGSSAIDQLALADFIERGELGRHLRRMRSVYRLRRDALLAGFGRYLPEVCPVGASAGLHVLAWLPAGVGESALVTEAAGRGVGLTGVAETYAGQPTRAGLVFGYATVDEHRIASGLGLLSSLGAYRARIAVTGDVARTDHGT